jgi:hypothetical protein
MSIVAVSAGIKGPRKTPPVIPKNIPPKDPKKNPPIITVITTRYANEVLVPPK